MKNLDIDFIKSFIEVTGYYKDCLNEYCNLAEKRFSNIDGMSKASIASELKDFNSSLERSFLKDADSKTIDQCQMVLDNLFKEETPESVKLIYCVRELFVSLAGDEQSQESAMHSMFTYRFH